jgi:hypothetical protein
MAGLQPAALFDLLPKNIVDGIVSAEYRAWIYGTLMFPVGILETISMAVCPAFQRGGILPEAGSSMEYD